ncbi:MAG: 6-phosphofructokinase [Armatimonadetes bacterium]|nr:6-phosphofructokinase [Armatimonadota bacterium]
MRLAIMVGGGPAPGINGVIGAATIEAINRGFEVVGLYDGFQWLMKGDTSHAEPLKISDVSRIHFEGGSILRTSRANPTKNPSDLQTVIQTLRSLNITHLVTIGGDDTAYSARRVCEASDGTIKVAHVPKTIDNDLPLPGGYSTFGFQTARHVGTEIVQTIMTDAKTTSRWYFLVAMGRSAGHLALGISVAAGATVCLIPEEFPERPVTLDALCDVLEGSILKRLAMARSYGVAILAEGLAELLDPNSLGVADVERDEHGHVRLAEIEFGRMVKDRVRARLKARGITLTIVDKDIGYELRCAPPIPFDQEYTRQLGYGVAKFLASGGSGGMMSRQGDRILAIPFEEIADPTTGRTRIRYVDVRAEVYEVARHYMIRLAPQDFENPLKLARLAEVAQTHPSEFARQFGHLARDPLIVPA